MMTKDHLLMIAQLAPNTIQAKKGDETMTRITQNVKNGRLVGLSLLLLGCAGGVESQQPARVAGTQPAMTLPTVYVTADDAGTVSVRMQKANALLLQGQWASAAEAFDRIVSLEPAGPYAPAALFNGGFAWEQIGRAKEELERYRQLIDRFADRQEPLCACIRASRLSSRG